MIFWGINDNLNIPSTKLHNIFTYCNNFTAIYSKNALILYLKQQKCSLLSCS